jgi:4-amino-4-deoxy-L-arabinose transferase-like glycosyltransferase
MEGEVPTPPQHPNRTLLALSALVLLALLAGSAGYGPHRDELYFRTAGEHLAWGYPDQGPLTPAVAALCSAIAPRSLVVLRMPSALAVAATVFLTGTLARELGASRRAELIAASSAAAGSVFLIVGHSLSTATFDLLAWTLVTWLVVRALRRDEEHLWPLVGAVLGLALLNKPLPAFLGVALVAGVALAGPGVLLRNRWVWAGAGIALLLWSPWLIWQADAGWPQIDVSRNIAGGGSTSSQPRWAFLPFQLLLVSPVLAPIWIVGLWRLFRDDRLRDLRFLGWTWVVLSVLFLLTGGKPYYLAGMFPVLLAAGAPAVEGWLTRGRSRTAVLAAAVGLSAAVSVVLALPVLPERELAPVLAANSDVGETVGWPAFARTVAAVHAAAPDPRHTAVLGSNYGEAGAVDWYGPRLGLPHAYSGHNGYWDWGPPPDEMTAVVTVGFPPAALDRWFAGCQIEARIDNAADVDNDEHGEPVALCSSLRAPWSQLWPSLRSLG